MSERAGIVGEDGSRIEFALYHSLVDDDPNMAAPALECLGRAAASWSRLEHHIDALIVQVNKPHYSEDLFQPHPVSFGKKIDLLKRWFNNYPPLASYTEDVRYLTSKLKELSKDTSKSPNAPITRNLLLHSIPAAYDPDGRTIELHHMSMDGGDIRSRHITVPLGAIDQFSFAVQLGNQLLSYITKELFTPEGLEKLQKPE